jgi:hypothetical protein
VATEVIEQVTVKKLAFHQMDFMLLPQANIITMMIVMMKLFV